MPNEHLYKTISSITNFRCTHLEMEEIKAAIKKDEQEETTAYDMCPTGNPSHCHLPDGSCKQCTK